MNCREAGLVTCTCGPHLGFVLIHFGRHWGGQSGTESSRQKSNATIFEQNPLSLPTPARSLHRSLLCKNSNRLGLFHRSRDSSCCAMASQGLLSNEILVLLRQLTEAELVDDAFSLHADACLAAAIFFLRKRSAAAYNCGSRRGSRQRLARLSIGPARR